MSHHISRRAPMRKENLSWGRFPTTDGSAVTYRLFHRDHAGALHMMARTFLAGDNRNYIAASLLRIKRTLRNHVAEIERTAVVQLDTCNG